jgi:hypothetical protein
VAYHLRAYDKQPELVRVAFDIPAGLLPLVKDLVPESAADPDLIEPHAIACNQAQRLAQELRISVDPEAFDFYIEADEDWRTAGERRGSARVRA